MTDELRARIDELVGENLELKKVNEANEEKMRANRQELGQILKREDLRILPLGYATLKLNVTRASWNWDYIKSLPGFNRKKAFLRVKAIPFVSICTPKTQNQ